MQPTVRLTLIGFLSLACAVASAQTPLPTNLDSHLQELIREVATGQPLQPGLPTLDAMGRVKVVVRLNGASTPAEVAQLLSNAGSAVDSIPEVPGGVRELVAAVPVKQLATLAQAKGVQAILVWYGPKIVVPVPRPQNISQLHAALARAAAQTFSGQAPSTAAGPIGVTALTAAYPQYTGAGQTIAVISDSYNTCTSCSKRAADDIASNNLPGVGNPAGNTSPVVVVGTDTPNGSDEGRAMLQLIYGLAPGAKLCHGSGGNSSSNMAAQIAALAKPLAQGGTCGATVIVDDLGYGDEPFFSDDGTIALAASQAVQQGVVYLSAAGNVRGMYDGTWAPITDAAARAGSFGNLKLSTVPAALTAGGFHNFSSNGGSQISFSVTPVANLALSIALGWNDPFTTGQTITSDYNLLVFDANGNYLPAVSSTNVNSQTGQPLETITLPSTTTATTYQIVISAASVGTATKIRLIPGKDQDQYTLVGIPTVESPAIYGHPAAPGVIGVAAYGWQTPNTPESFSSAGPYTVYLDGTGTRLSSPVVRQQPVVAGFDGDYTTYFGQPSTGSNFPSFFGTSAASPTAAAIAALVLQAKPTATPAQVSAFLAASASHTGLWAPKDGVGWVNAFNAVTRAAGTNTQSASSVTLSADVNPATVGSTITFTANVPAKGATQATGYVFFYDGTTPLGGVQLVSGSAQLQVSTLTAGAHSITAQYAGDTNFLQSMSSPLSVSVVGTNSLWTVNSDNTLTKISTSGVVAFTTAATDNMSVSLHSIAFDNAGNVWTVNNNNSVYGISKINAATGAITAKYTGSVGQNPSSLAVDGSGTIWLASDYGLVTGFNQMGVITANSYGQTFNSVSPTSISVDNSGAIWVGTNGSGGVTLVKIFGVATPTVAPLSTGITNNTLGVAP